jgi:hypothetical protein
VTAARVRLPDGAGPAERSVLALLADLAGRGGQVTIDPAHVGPVTCLHRTVVIRALDRLSARGLLRREGRTVVLTAAHRPSGDQT